VVQHICAKQGLTSCACLLGRRVRREAVKMAAAAAKAAAAAAQAAEEMAMEYESW